jgi:3-oxoacid CoA-transferase subunit A
MQNKVCSNAHEALKEIKSGVSIMSGGFGLCGIPENLIEELSIKDLSSLTLISNNIGNAGKGLSILLRQGKVKKAICSYVGGNPDLEKLMINDEIEVELVPQGTFSERIRAHGVGIRAFFTPTGYGTVVANNKEVKKFDKECILEESLGAEYAIIKAQKGDKYGNLFFKETARNFSPLMAMAANNTIVEVEELVEVGEINPHDVHLPGIFVQKIFQGTDYNNDIEFLIEQET